MRYLITGGAGFLGSNLARRLLNQGHEIHIIDNLSSSNGDNLAPLLKDGVVFYKYDVTQSYQHLFGSPIPHIEFDGIFNLACPASPPFYQNMPIETNLTSVLGARNALELALEHDCPVLQTSTSEVYGDPDVSPQREDYRGNVNCFGPRACYDEGKRAAEALFYDYQKQRNANIRIVRIFNTYGPGMLSNDGRVVSNFINQALRNEPITIYGDGSQTRSFCYVDDLIDALLVVWNSDYTKPVNTGNPDEFTILELAEKVIQLTNSSSVISFQQLPEDDPLQRRPNITLAKSLGWDGPKISLDKGLESTVEYFRGMKNHGEL